MTTTQEVGTMRETCDHNGCSAQAAYSIAVALGTATHTVVTCAAHTARMADDMRTRGLEVGVARLVGA